MADSDLLLRVTARPHEVLETDERVWLEPNPRQLDRVALSDPLVLEGLGMENAP